MGRGRTNWTPLQCFSLLDCSIMKISMQRYRSASTSNCSMAQQVLVLPLQQRQRHWGGDDDYTSVWRSALCGMLPSLIKSLDRTEAQTLRKCMASVVDAMLSEPSQALAGCEVVLASNEEKKKKKSGGGSGADEEADMMLDVFIGTDDGPTRQAIRAALLRSLEDKDLLLRKDWITLNGHEAILEDCNMLTETFSSELEGNPDSSSSSLTTSLETLFEHKFSSDCWEDEGILDRFLQDYASQHAFAQAVVKFTSDSIVAVELDNLSKMCKAFMAEVVALDVLLLYVCPTQLLQPIAGLLNDQELLHNGEEAAVVGGILLFAQLLIQKSLCANYNLEDLLPSQEHRFLACFVRSSGAIQVGGKLAASEQSIIFNWLTALFGSEGISDELIKTSSPQLLLRLTPTLFSQSITACCSGVIDLDTLRGGLTYFLQDLLSYTLPSALNWLLCDLARCQAEETMCSLQSDEASKARWTNAKAIRMEVLSTLLLSETCPQIVQTLLASRAGQVLSQLQLPDSSTENDRLTAAMQGRSGWNKGKRTHLWIHIAQRSMTSSNLDSLLNLDVSFSSLIHKRGAVAALQVIFDSLLLNSKSHSLAKSVALSLCLALGQIGPKAGLADEVIVQFARLAMLPGNGVKSVIDTLHHILSLLQSCPSPQRESRGIQQLSGAVQAIVALHVTRQLRKAKGREDVGLIARLYGVLFQRMPPSSLLVRALSAHV